MTEYLIGTGGWAYFNASDKPSIKAYARLFNFVEVNYTFYNHPSHRMVENWRRVAPKNFTFTVRCNQDLTHRIGLRAVDEAYEIFDRMLGICRILEAPVLHLETPRSYVLDKASLAEARQFFSTINPKGVRLAWELRNLMTKEVRNLMQDFGIIHSVDLSREGPAWDSDMIYTRLFGKGKHNRYQFIDEEIVEIDQRIAKLQAKKIIASFHGLRMNTDALRFKQYRESGIFSNVTPFTGADSARSVLSEDAKFPSAKDELIEDQGWKVFDLTANKRVHLSELLSRIPERTYKSLDEVINTFEGRA